MVVALHTPAAQSTAARLRHFNEIETRRLRLRLFTPNDLDALCALTSDHEVMRFIGEGVVQPREQIEQNLTNIIAAFRRRGYGRWAIEEKMSGRLAGYCGFGFSVESVGPELVYLLGREFWGRGYVHEAGRACLRYGFEELGLDAVKAVTLPDNWRSRRVMERLGMRYVRSDLYHSYPCVVYELGRAEWQLDDSAYALHRTVVA
jgi:ribosomal-protein-alanine N-acetyltransferase